MANNACVALLQAEEPGEALSIVKDSVDIFEGLGDVRRQAMALGNRASALEALNRLEEAEADYLQSAELLKQIGENELRLNVMHSLSALKLRSGRSMEALADMQSGVEGLDKPKPRHRLLKRLLEVPSKLLNR
jgi:tetratricopeptide (TPR) repeat protein